MADVMAQPRASEDRGQLILVTGLLVAVTIVSLVLLLNTAIYTENLASRGTDQSGREAIEFRAVVVDVVGGLIEAENREEHGSWTASRDAVEDGVVQVDDLTARSHATGGVVAGVDRPTVTLHEGRLIRQTDSARAFTNATDERNDWRLAAGVEDTRAFSMTVHDTQLVSTTDAQADDDGAFYVDVDDGSGAWQVFVYEDGGSDIAIAVSDGVGDPTEVCSTSGTTATISLTAGTLNGTPCSGLRWADGVSNPYEIGFENGENVTGTYELTINGTGDVDANLNAPGASPYSVPAVYSASFDCYYRTPTLTYRVPVRVAPGEPA